MPAKRLGNILKQLKSVFGLKDYIANQSAEFISRIKIGVVFIMLSLIGIMFLSTGLSVYLNILLDSSYWGYFILGVIYLVSAATYYLINKTKF